MTAGNAHPQHGKTKPPFIRRLLRELWRLATDRSHRSVMWLYLRRPAGAYQPFNDTRDDRYPRIFRFVQGELGADGDVKILSFGCSTGDEVFSLRRYFPRAAIKGLDINSANIAEARRRLAQAEDVSIGFDVASSTAGEADASYDAIFCMAVLRHGSLKNPGVTRCDHLIRFEDFARTIADFDRCLKPGGLLIVRHSNFRVSDTPADADFECILRVKLPKGSGQAPIFGPDNCLKVGADYPDTVFRKKLSAVP